MLYFRLGLSALLMTFSASLVGQKPRTAAEPQRRWTAAPACFDPSRKHETTVTRTLRLFSPDLRYVAYAVNEATPSLTSDGTVTGCKSTTTLYILSDGTSKPVSVLVLGPRPEASGNSIQIIDWSPVGHQLLIGEGRWVWGSDAGSYVVRVYDADRSHANL